MHPCIGSGVSFLFEGARILYSNLGGMGPDTPDGASTGVQGIRFVNVGTFTLPSGAQQYFDLLVTNRSEYTPYDSSLNQLQGHFAQINLACNNQVDLRVTTICVPSAWMN